MRLEENLRETGTIEADRQVLLLGRTLVSIIVKLFIRTLLHITTGSHLLYLMGYRHISGSESSYSQQPVSYPTQSVRVLPKPDEDSTLRVLTQTLREPSVKKTTLQPISL